MVYYFLSLSFGMIFGYVAVFSYRNRNQSSSPPLSSANSSSSSPIKFIGKKTAVLDLGNDGDATKTSTKITMPVCIVNKKFSGRLRFSHRSNLADTEDESWTPLPIKIFEYAPPNMPSEICLFPPFSLQIQQNFELSLDLLNKNHDTVLCRLILFSGQDGVKENIFSFSKWASYVEDVIRKNGDGE